MLDTCLSVYRYENFFSIHSRIFNRNRLSYLSKIDAVHPKFLRAVRLNYNSDILQRPQKEKKSAQFQLNFESTILRLKWCTLRSFNI